MFDIQKFRAVKIDKEFNLLTCRKVELNGIKDESVVIRVQYSVFNHKDLLVSKGIEKTRRSYPHTVGIDAAGTIVFSQSSKFAIGEQVAVMATQAGISIDGGYAEYISVPADKILKIPEGFTARDAMLFGTAGLTAALSVSTIMNNQHLSLSKPILVTGGSSGVGLISAILLNQEGFDVSISTNNHEARKFFYEIGIVDVISRLQHSRSDKFSLLPEKWSSCIDVVGGTGLSMIVKSVSPKGRILSIGSLAGESSDINLNPFYLRGISLIGIDTESLSCEERSKLLSKFFTENLISILDGISSECELFSVPELMHTGFFSSKFGRHLIHM